jgi:hypothetical protein
MCPKSASRTWVRNGSETAEFAIFYRIKIKKPGLKGGPKDWLESSDLRSESYNLFCLPL